MVGLLFLIMAQGGSPIVLSHSFLKGQEGRGVLQLQVPAAGQQIFRQKAEDIPKLPHSPPVWAGKDFGLA